MLLVVLLNGCYVLQEQCVLGRSFGSVCALDCLFLELSALASVCVDDDGSVVALDNRRHDANSSVLLRVGDEDTIQDVGSAGRLVDDLRQACPLH